MPPPVTRVDRSAPALIQRQPKGKRNARAPTLRADHAPAVLAVEQEDRAYFTDSVAPWR